MSVADLQARIRDVPDFPEPGIVFKDIMPMLSEPKLLREAVDLLAEWAEPRKPDVILGGEARGFILGAALAQARLRLRGRAPPGKLPWETISASYALEYGENASRCIRCSSGRVLLHDDVLATGGTARAIVELAENLGGEVVGIAS